jgi:transcriptional regulator with GAF, ATPase, and Fis domain
MKPSQGEGIAGYIDTAAERDVIRDALDDPHVIMTQPFDSTLEGYEDSTLIRMWNETLRGAPVYVGTFGFGMVTTTDVGGKKEVPVRDEDVRFVLQAAERVLENRSAHRILHNSVTGRLRAARNMVRFFAEAGYPEAIVCEGLYGRTTGGHRKKVAKYDI